MKWQPITDLPDDPRSLTDGELIALLRVWKSQKTELAQGGTLDEFDKRLRREWAIETGIIEDVYTLDRGVTKTLIERGIDAALIPHNATNRDSTLVARIIQDHYDALDGMFDFVAGRRPLSTSYLKELHAALLRNVETHTVQDKLGQVFEKSLEKGQYKTVPNSPTRHAGLLHEYCPPEHVASEMDQLIRMHLEHEAHDIPPEVSAAWLHHRFTQIHPFADGNGRVARALASLVFIKAGWFPLVVKRDDRVRYVESLEVADRGALEPLVALFVEVQRNLLISASEIAYDVSPITSAHDAVLAARDRLAQRRNLPLKEWAAAEVLTQALRHSAVSRLNQIAGELRIELRDLASHHDFSVIANDGPDIRLRLNTTPEASLVLSFGAIGPSFRGLTNVTALFAFQGVKPALPVEPFLINYEEDLASAQSRFSVWLERAIVDGLNKWRLTL